MKVLSAIYNEQKNASPKAPADIDKILKEKYNAKTKTLVRNKLFKIKALFYFFLSKFSRDIIVLQMPLLFRAKLYDLLDKDRTILLIHDINSLRSENEELVDDEMLIYKKFKYIIVHNDSMKRFMISKGINENNLYVLEIFDYLTNNSKIENRTFDKNSIKIVYPGNLNKKKSPFLFQLDESKMKYEIYLYGLGIDKDINSKLIYKGAFEPDDINLIEGDVGLIWDGNFDESDENFKYKKYTKYNNPHKLSCCLAIGIPVIVWKKAAIADFVTKNNVGYTISNIYDINNIDFSDYEEKKKNAIKIGNRLRKGYYTKKVFSEIVNQINEKDKH